ncbi:MAG TPA: Na+/H+ antiporter subunit C [Arsenicitalea sp.]|jgi:multicomponent Na+:H+ antiporter subunit C|nr:Na+/H+ antiporter subunit C [Arsenicitalea sp.]
METALAALVGLFISVAIYLLLSRALIRMLLGLVILGNGVNLLIFTAGRLASATPPIVPAGLSAPVGPTANPLPQALILTAIVIGFAMFAFLLVLAMQAYRTLGAERSDQLRLAEPEPPPQPPLSY